MGATINESAVQSNGRNIGIGEDSISRGCLTLRIWESEGTCWLQRVSATPATRLDVVALRERLDRQLTQRQASWSTMSTLSEAKS